jgi:hypothetical protein
MKLTLRVRGRWRAGKGSGRECRSWQIGGPWRADAAAARRLDVDPTTVGRRPRAVETALNAKLFERDADGHLRAIDAGGIVIRRAEAIEAEVCNLDVAVQPRPSRQPEAFPAVIDINHCMVK